MIALLLKHKIHNKDVLKEIINELQKKVERQRIKWENKQNQKFFDLSTLKYGPRGYN